MKSLIRSATWLFVVLLFSSWSQATLIYGKINARFDDPGPSTINPAIQAFYNANLNGTFTIDFNDRVRSSPLGVGLLDYDLLVTQTDGDSVRFDTSNTTSDPIPTTGFFMPGSTLNLVFAQNAFPGLEPFRDNYQGFLQFAFLLPPSLWSQYDILALVSEQSVFTEPGLGRGVGSTPYLGSMSFGAGGGGALIRSGMLELSATPFTTSTAIPEPSTIFMIVIGLMGILARNRIAKVNGC